MNGKTSSPAPPRFVMSSRKQPQLDLKRVFGQAKVSKPQCSHTISSDHSGSQAMRDKARYIVALGGEKRKAVNPEITKVQRMEMDPLPRVGPPPVFDKKGMLLRASRAQSPKLKFTPEDDQLLIDLKEKKNLTWKQIADFFPGRSSGTLQVRYVTKLKAKEIVWTEETTKKLRSAMQEYENDRWRIISTKVGNGFSPASCREKAMELASLAH